jgi:hypothetical protein
MHERLLAVGRVAGPALLVLGLAVAVTQINQFSSASEPDHEARPAAAPDRTHATSSDAVAEYELGVAAAYAGALSQAQAEAYWQAVAAEAAAQQAASSRSGGGGGGPRRSSCADPLACIRECESHGNYGAVSSGGTYRGAYQFSQSTWEAMGGTGDPAAAPPEEQDARAAALYSSAGSSPWPVCG